MAKEKAKKEKKKSSFWKDFKAFISRGNIVDLAVAVVVGAAFTAIVNSWSTTSSNR
ncbi:MAG TPA: MscL family protein [Candidatus Borkfalkia stercoripullorum]|nr:MscL family protein [Candidatus Borkfalkia stercoripullorum]